MRNLVELLSRFGHIFLFLFLEIVCFTLIVRYNQTQNEIWANTTSIFADGIKSRVNSISQYSQLQQVNDSLRAENAQLLERIINFSVYDRDQSFQKYDSDSSNIVYRLIPVSICDKTVHLRNNNMTLCQGESSHVRSRMGLITKKGVVGMTSACSENFCKALLITNNLSRISALIKGKDYNGNITWPGTDPRVLEMRAVPKYANVVLGDTIVTSGYSTLFPPNIPIGLVTNFEVVKGQNELSIEVSMMEDMATLQEAYAIEFIKKEEKQILEASTNE